MANYVLTQTGQEVQDILDSMGATYFFSQTATFASDNTYADYPYKGTISLVGVDGTMGVEVSFSNDQAISGNYSPICNTTNDAVEIWSKVNTSITIPTIKIYKNGYVNLNGSSNYMPQSGGNFTGAVTINNSAVVTQSNLVPQSITLTANTTNVPSIGTSTRAYRIGRMVFATIYCQASASLATNSLLISGLPVPIGSTLWGFAMSTNVGNYSYRAKVDSSGNILTEGAWATTQAWYMGNVAYVTAS